MARGKYYYIEDDRRIFKEINGEIWSNVLGFPDYWVNKKGEVMGRTGKLLKPATTKKGYLRLPFYTSDKVKAFAIHRLVADAFIPNPENKPQVNHINCDKKDNRVENLEWVTDEENRKHKLENNLNVTAQGTKHVKSKINEEIAKDIFLSKETDNYLSEKYDISKSLVNGIRTGRNWGWYTKNLDKENR